MTISGTREIISYPTPQGQWACRCQVAGHDYQNPQMIPGLFTRFTNNLFGVTFLQLNSFNLYERLDPVTVNQSDPVLPV